MLNELIRSLIGESKMTPPVSRRDNMRRAGGHCVAIINGKMYPVENWSEGGILIAGDERLFSVGQDCAVTLKFKLRNEVFDIPHRAKIIRKASGSVAMRYLPTTGEIHARFQKVIDDFLAQSFCDSQLV